MGLAPCPRPSPISAAAQSSTSESIDHDHTGEASTMNVPRKEPVAEAERSLRRGHLRRRLGRPERDEVSHKSRYCRHAPDQERCWSQPNAGRRFGVRGVYHNVTTTPRLSTAFLGGWWRALAPERH